MYSYVCNMKYEAFIDLMNQHSQLFNIHISIEKRTVLVQKQKSRIVSNTRDEKFI